MERTPEGKIKVYDLETGKVREHWPVDGRDIVIAGEGRYAFSLLVAPVDPPAPVYTGTPEEITQQFYEEAIKAGYYDGVAANLAAERFAKYTAKKVAENVEVLPPSPHLGKVVPVPFSPVLAKSELTLDEAKKAGELAPGVPLVITGAGPPNPTVITMPKGDKVSPSL